MTCESCTLLFEEIKGLKKQNEQQEERIKQLEKLLTFYQNPHTPPSQNRFPKKLESHNHHKPGQKKGHEGVTRKEPEPDKTIELTANVCPHCGSKLGEPSGTQRRLIEDIPKVQQRIVTEFLVNFYHCDNCNQDIVPTHPDLPKEGKFGNNTITQAALMKFDDRLPYRKIMAVMMRNYALAITAGSLVEMVNRSATALRPNYMQILVAVRNSAYIYADETSIKVNGVRFWIWIFVTENDVLCIVAASRGSKVLKALKGFKGKLVCDGWKPYTTFAEIIQRCWAHLLREADSLPDLSEAKKLANEIHSIFNDCKEFMENNPSEDARKSMHEAMGARMKWLVQLNYESEAVKKFASKISNGFEYWFTFILHPEIEPTNNIAERALREHVVIRKIIGTLRNKKGVFMHETIMTCLQSWEKQGLNSQERLLQCLRS